MDDTISSREWLAAEAAFERTVGLMSSLIVSTVAASNFCGAILLHGRCTFHCHEV